MLKASPSNFSKSGSDHGPTNAAWNESYPVCTRPVESFAVTTKEAAFPAVMADKPEPVAIERVPHTIVAEVTRLKVYGLAANASP
eukprot:3251045-Rhodomonas_salina.2